MKFDLSILPVLSALLCLGLGIFTLTRNPKHAANIGLAAGMILISFSETGKALSLLSETSVETLFWNRIALGGEILFPPVWLLFSLTFARVNYQETLFRWKWVLVSAGFLSLFFLLWLTSPKMIALSLQDEIDAPLLLGPVGRFFLIFFLLGMVLSLILLENTFRCATGTERERIKYLLIGVGGISAFQIYLASQSLLYSQIDPKWIPLTSGVLLIAGGMIFFFIITHRLLGADIYISRYVVYKSFTVLFVGGYLLTVGLAAQVLQWLGGPSLAFWIPILSFLAIAAGVIILFSARIRRKVQHFINRHFYRQKYDFREKWMETTERLGSTTSLETIQKAVVAIVQETLGAREVALYLSDPEYGNFYPAESTFPERGRRIAPDHPLVRQGKKNSASFYLDPEEKVEGIPPHISLCTPLVFGSELVGFLLQDKDLSGIPYGPNDFEILKAIATQAASQITGIRLAKALMAAKEAEAFHQVSSFFIHDLKNFVSTLSLLVQNAEEHIADPAFQRDAIHTLAATASKMNGMISRLALLSKRFEIHPQPVDLNGLLDQSLATLNGLISSRMKKSLTSIPKISADGEQVQKVILNLLLNAIEASPGNTTIRLRTEYAEGNVLLSVLDHGCGMSDEFIRTSLFRPFRSTKPHGLGIGLFQCRKIMEAHGGKIEVESGEGRGSEFRLIFPLQARQTPE